MGSQLRAIKVTENVYWVGAIDWALRDFHGYSTNRGTTYNAFLILADKITLIDTVKHHFQDELLARISSMVKPQEIDIIISNHAEMDHSGCLPQIIKYVQPSKVYASVRGKQALAEHFRREPHLSIVEVVKSGDTINLGNLTLQFLETPMLHWPDSMFSYLVEEKLLFSQDAFGMHLATGKRFADQVADEILEYEAAKYYANILLPYSKLITKLLGNVSSLGLEFDIIAPDHGPIWRSNVNRIISFYARWAEQKPAPRIIITYDTMWQSTALMARAIANGAIDQGVSVKVMPLSVSHRSDIATELLNAAALVVGSPTINNNIFPTIADLFCYIRGLKRKNLCGFAFGSYGWSGESIKQVEESLKTMGVEITGECIKAKYVPDEQVLEKCYNQGEDLAKKIKNICV